jgi:segregation and condensation protein A
MTADTAAPGGIQLTLPHFEGPLDLLLHLIEREELDITSVALVTVADQYLRILRDQEQVNLDALADFIWIGARLLLIKSRALLPRPPAEDGIEEDDDAGDLARQLIEYKLFKDAAGQLRDIERTGMKSYPRIAPPPDLPPPPGLDGVTLDMLRAMVEVALARKPEAKDHHPVIRPYKFTVREKVEYLRTRLAESGRVSFRGIIDACRTRMEIIVSFMAVLELIKSRVLEAMQDASFSDIVLVPAEDQALDVEVTSEFDD